MPAAVIGGAIAAVGTVGGAIMSSKAQKKAANQASQTAADNTAANNALTRDIYNQNKTTLAPFVNQGTQATSAINALLGLGGPAQPATQQPQQQAPQTQQFQTGQQFAQGNYRYPSVVGDGNMAWQGEPAGSIMPAIGGQYGYNPTDTMVGQTQQATAAPTTTAPAGQTAQQQYQNAFDNYKNSTGYQFRVGEGIRALDASASARGVRQSGAAAKSLAEFGQGIASQEFGNYLGALTGQQQVGLAGASAQAGVSQNMVNNVTANNNSAASAAANAALARGTATGQMWGGVANGLGNFASSFLR